ncbi:hypothetical protein BLOT_006358 [Blomia tropicalis]|nr:hypothetical protein BLOT_006358 [Blomia tropicalis]
MKEKREKNNQPTDRRTDRPTDPDGVIPVVGVITMDDGKSSTIATTAAADQTGRTSTITGINWRQRTKTIIAMT